MPDIRAKLSEERGEQLLAIRESLGYSKTVEVLDYLILQAYLHLCYSNTARDIKRKAAICLTRFKKLAMPLNENDIEKVSFVNGTVQVWTSFSGEAYLIPEREWHEANKNMEP